MAEIKIEKKSPVWPWILVLIVVVAIVAYFIYNNDNTDSMLDNNMNNGTTDTISNNYEEDYPPTIPYMDSSSAVEEFENSIIDSTRIGVDSSYTKTAIINLAKVITMKADQLNVQPSIALKNLKNYSNQRNGMTDSESYKDIKTVSNDIVTVLETIQTKRYPLLQDEVSELKQTSNKIDDNTATKEQQNTLQTFLSKAKEVVNNMNT